MPTFQKGPCNNSASFKTKTSYAGPTWPVLCLSSLGIIPLLHSSLLPPSGQSFPHVGGPFSTILPLSNLNSLFGPQVQHDYLRAIFLQRKSGPSAPFSIAYYPPPLLHLSQLMATSILVVINLKIIIFYGHSLLWSRDGSSPKFTPRG